jgi:hypothetical protein
MSGTQAQEPHPYKERKDAAPKLQNHFKSWNPNKGRKDCTFAQGSYIS